jgi:hypothetical protein
MWYVWVGVGLGALCFIVGVIAVLVFVRRRKKGVSDAAIDGMYSATAAGDMQSARSQIYGSAPKIAEYGPVATTAYSGMPYTSSEIMYASANVSKREIVYDATMPLDTQT